MTDPSTNTNTTEPDEPQRPEEGRPADGAQLGEGGRKALDAERQARRDAEKRARDAEEKLAAMETDQARRRIAAEKGLSDEQAKFLGDGDEQAMAARADELLAAFRAEERGGIHRRPQERLRPGAAPSSEPEDLGKIADEVMRG